MEAPASLAAAETAFAAHSVREDMRVAFLAAFADDGVFVRDGWTNSNQWLANRPPPPIVLDWRPAYAETASSGELGLSTGPWKITSKTKADAPAQYGQFVSVWRREANGRWKVAVDLGISHAEPVLWDRPLVTAVAAGATRPSLDLRQAEDRFAADARMSGPRSAYARHGADNLRFYRSDFAPAIGKAAAMQSPAMSDAPLVWTVERIETARSGDFGYARGSYAAANAPAKPIGYFLRVWRVEGGNWRIAMDVVNPAPKS